MDLFSARADEEARGSAPLAARMRPRTLDEFVGQRHVLGPGSALRSLVEADELRSVVLWGPAGTGKTSLAHIIAGATRSKFEELSATSAGVKDVRAVLAAARERLGALGRRTILFIDEIHRFNKAQQDALLPGVEDRTVVLVGATTENPFFTVNAPLMSRSLLFRLEPLDARDLETILRRALADPERGLGGSGLALDDDALAHLVDRADGDARHGLNALEAAALVVASRGDRRIALADIEDALQRPRVVYDRAGDQHYDVASAFIKSIRGSDPDAALHYLARMLAAGEDPRFIARRLVISASEDVGLADPAALGVAVAAFQALELIGLPEARLNLAEAVVYLALAPKSNSAYLALAAAQAELESGRPGRVPGHLQSASHPGEKAFGIGAGYVYPHDRPGHWVEQRYLPEGLRGGYYTPSDQGREPQLADAWQRRGRLRAAVPPSDSGKHRAGGRTPPEPPVRREVRRARPDPPDPEEPTP
ncbi:MAG TPA: replication-associated recombination protein A [Actinomycetes bacterium]|jgi:putative ATPase|nr:replication-associated recombination protein A [Actinomycetes bacterium]